MVETAVAVEEFVLSLTGSPWLLLAVVVLATIDGFFPPVPSESVVIAVAVLTVAGDGPSLWFLVLAAALGAFLGDLIAYTIGSRVRLERLRMFRSRRGRRTISWARRALALRGTVFILSARFVPIGRVAVNMTAGAVGFPRRRFVVIAAIAALIWGGYSTLLGMSAGVFLHDHPLVAVAVGLAGGVLAGFAVDRMLAEVQRRWFPRMPSAVAMLHEEDLTPRVLRELSEEGLLVDVVAGPAAPPRREDDPRAHGHAADPGSADDAPTRPEDTPTRPADDTAPRTADEDEPPTTRGQP